MSEAPSERSPSIHWFSLAPHVFVFPLTLHIYLEPSPLIFMGLVLLSLHNVRPSSVLFLLDRYFGVSHSLISETRTRRRERLMPAEMAWMHRWRWWRSATRKRLVVLSLRFYLLLPLGVHLRVSVSFKFTMVVLHSANFEVFALALGNDLFVSSDLAPTRRTRVDASIEPTANRSTMPVVCVTRDLLNWRLRKGRTSWWLRVRICMQRLLSRTSTSGQWLLTL